MPIESATYINQLNSSYPAATDGVKEGDDHIRLVKQVLKDTFPNITGPVTKTQAEINSPGYPFPIGGIIMWSGLATALPANFKLCDGASYTRTDGAGTIATPDLRNRFIVGAGSSYNIGDTGGADTVTLTTAQIPAHTHTLNLSGSVGAAGSHNHIVNDPGHFHYYSALATDSPHPTGANSYEARGTTTSYTTSYATTGIYLSAVGDHTHSLSLSGSANNTGGGGSHENRPPYYALAFIMRI